MLGFRRARWARGHGKGWMNRHIKLYFWFVGWDCFSIGIHFSIKHPAIDLHIPFGFVGIAATDQFDRKAYLNDPHT